MNPIKKAWNAYSCQEKVPEKVPLPRYFHFLQKVPVKYLGTLNWKVPVLYLGTFQSTWNVPGTFA